MALMSVAEVSQELSVPAEFLEDLIRRQLIIPYGGRARLGEPRFSTQSLPYIRSMIQNCSLGSAPHTLA